MARFEATYTLAQTDGELKIVQVISENEQPKFMGVMRARARLALDGAGEDPAHEVALQ
jgi:hypothetical protein